MRKKFCSPLAAFVRRPRAQGFVLRQQFYGKCGRYGRDLYVSARPNTGRSRDSPAADQTPPGFRPMPGGSTCPETFKPALRAQTRHERHRNRAHAQAGVYADPRAGDDQQRAHPAQLAQKLARQIDADSTAIMQALTSEELAAEVGFDSVTLFSMFIPDSYEFYWTVTPGEFVQRMKREYDRFWTSERDVKRKRSGLSRLEVMTLASIVYEETPQERRDAPRGRGSTSTA